MKTVHKILIPSAAVLASLITLPSGAAYASSPFANCTEAYEAGYSHIPASHPYYGKHLDRDSDGVACDTPPADFTAASPTPTPTPTPTPDASLSTGEDLAETGAGVSPLPFVMGAGLLVLLGGAALTVHRRRTR